MDSVFWKIGQFLPLPFSCRKVRVQLSSSFFVLLSLISHSGARFEHVFYWKNTSKVGIIQRRKTRLWKIFKIKKFLLGVLWHCNDVVYPLNGRYFFKKLFPVSKHQVRDNLQFQQNPWNKWTLNHLAKWMDECSFPN